MTSTHRATIAAPVTQCLAATALIAGIAFGAIPIAGAVPYDESKYNACMRDMGARPGANITKELFNSISQFCCQLNGGVVWTTPTEGYKHCLAPAEEVENVPQPPGPTEPPPVLDPGQIGPSNPLIPVPRGPNSGTLAP
jgi:hypothetical protein